MPASAHEQPPRLNGADRSWQDNPYRNFLDNRVVDGEIIVLQPRRLAARLVAQRIAEERGEQLGDLVGYQTRYDRQVSDRTRIRFLTEGLFLRRLQGDPDLRGVGAVLLDEFHERSVAADLSLGLVRQLQETRRPELRLASMSATLEDALSDWLTAPRSVPKDAAAIRSTCATDLQMRIPHLGNRLRMRSQALESEAEGDILRHSCQGRMRYVAPFSV